MNGTPVPSKKENPESQEGDSQLNNEQKKRFSIIGVDEEQFKNHLKNLTKNYDKTDDLLTDKLAQSFSILEEREKLKLDLKRIFFFRIMSLLTILICSPFILTIICVINGNNNTTFITAIVASLVELTTGIIVLPKIIARYLFNESEDKLYFDLIKDLKDYHNSKKSDIK